MGRQSSRLIYRGKDIKDLVYRGNFLNKLYKGNDLVWEKLYRYFVGNGDLSVYDFGSKKYLYNSYKYMASHLKRNPNNTISIFYDREEKRYFLAISEDSLRWKELKELEYESECDYYFSSSDDGFFIYQINKSTIHQTLYHITIDYGLQYTIKKIYSADTFTGYQYGVSNYYYELRYEGFRKTVLYRIGKNKDVVSKQLMGNFARDDLNMFYGGSSLIADGIGNVYIICYDVDATNGGTVIYKVQGMDTEHIYTAFWCRTVEILNGAQCGIDIIYDSYQTLFLAHRGYHEEESFQDRGDKYSRATDGYYNMAFYVIDSVGNTLLTAKKRNHEINIKCIGIPGRDYITIKFGGGGSWDRTDPDTQGFIYFATINKGVSSSRDDNTSCVFDYDKTPYNNCFVGTYSWVRAGEGTKKAVIFIDNLYFNESNGNLITVTD